MLKTPLGIKEGRKECSGSREWVLSLYLVSPLGSAEPGLHWTSLSKLSD